MVVSEGHYHDRPDDYLAVDDDRFLLDGMHAEHGGLREVDNRSSVQRAEDASVRAAGDYQLRVRR